MNFNTYITRLLVFCLLVFHFSCVNDAKENGGQSQVDTANFTLETPAEKFPVVKSKKQGSAAAPKPVADLPEADFLTEQFIVVERCINSNDPEWAKTQRGLWFRFDKSGSMVLGQWDQQLSQGSWFLVNNKDRGRRFLFIDAEDDSYDGEWEIQGISNSNGEMVMVKSKLYERKNVHLKVMQLLTVPTKEQFGIAG